jgi:plastocyanin
MLPILTARKALALALGIASLALAGPGGALAADKDHPVVVIGNFTFDPAALSVPAGTAVTWVNHDDIPHTTTSATKDFGSPVLDTDDSFTFRFARPGTYSYFCKLHPHMQGTIEVTPANG